MRTLRFRSPPETIYGKVLAAAVYLVDGHLRFVPIGGVSGLQIDGFFAETLYWLE